MLIEAFNDRERGVKIKEKNDFRTQIVLCLIQVEAL